jgi:hypothetical protein
MQREVFVRRTVLGLLLGFGSVATCFAPFAAAQVAGSPVNKWSRTADLTAPRAQACSAVLNDGRLLVAGGLGDNGPVATVDIYGTDGSFRSGAPMNQARARAACVTLPDGTVLVTGGDSGSGALNTAEVFDPVAGSWQATGNLGVARGGHQAAVTVSGNVWIAGGTNHGAIVGTIELYAAGKFRTLGSLNTPRTKFAMTLAGKRSLLVAGGTDGTNTLDTVEVYDGLTGALALAGTMLQARKDFAAAAMLDGTVLLAGGIDANGDILSSTEIFDPVAGAAVAGPALTAPRANHSASALPNNGSILIFGGTGNSTVLGTTDIYTPWTGAIALGSSLNVERRDEAKATLRPGSFMIAGGRNESGLLSSTELFQFATIGTDKSDYAPGTPVKISGGGWVPGEQVLVQIAALPADRHHIEFTGAAVADGAGNITVPGFAVDKSHLGMKFLMTSTGSQSQAQATFTDGLNPIISYAFTPPSGATPGAPVGVTVTLTPPDAADLTPTGAIIPCTDSACPTNLTVSGASCGVNLQCTLSAGAGNTATVSFSLTLPAGSTTFSVEYSGDAIYNFEVPAAGTTPPGAPIVTYTAQSFTVTDLTGGPAVPASYGTQTPYVANVCISATSGGACLGSGTLSGNVQFFVNSVASGNPVTITPAGSNTGAGTAQFIPNPPLAVGGPYVITAAYGNDPGNAGSNSSAANGGAASISTTIVPGALVGITVMTVPSTLSVTVDGTIYTAPVNLTWQAGSSHTLSVGSTIIGVSGTRYIFSSWSQGGPASQTVIAPLVATTYTANYLTQYLLTTAVNPPGSGSITAGGWFDAGTTLSISASANTGYTFSSFSGSLTSASSPVSITINAPANVVANFAAMAPSLSAAITSRTGAASARQWTITLTNNGIGAGNNTLITGLTFTPAVGVTCSTPPSIVSPAFPLTIGNIAPMGSAAGSFIINFGGCPTNARFTVKVSFQANGGAYTGSQTFNNQFY